MLYSERKNYLYDPVIADLPDAKRMLRLAMEFAEQSTARPMPNFLEVDRTSGSIDPYWHMSKTPYTTFRRAICLPSVRRTARPQLVNGPQGQAYIRRDDFWVPNLALQLQDYFPQNGDEVAWNGYRYQVIEAIIDPETEFGQTGLWMWIVCRCLIVPLGDAQFPPSRQLGGIIPAEVPGALQTGGIPGVPN